MSSLVFRFVGCILLGLFLSSWGINFTQTPVSAIILIIAGNMAITYLAAILVERNVLT